MKKLPEKYVERMKRLLGEQYPLYEAALSRPPTKGFRVNTKKISAEDFEGINVFGAERIPYVEDGFYLDYEDKIGNHPFHHAGMVYVQEPAAMAPAECIDIQPDWWVLDMCAAPGGKSSQIAGKLGEGSVLVSNEIIPSRCRILTGNVERLGLTNVITTCMDTERLAAEFPRTFDLIMVDAPCSGEGMFRKEEIAIDEWSEDNVRMCAERQAKILDNAVNALSNGGYIVYATCTFSLEENEMTVDGFLRRHPEFEIVPVCRDVERATVEGIYFEGCACESIGYARRFYPHIGRGEGQFMAVLHSTLDKQPRGELESKTVSADGRAERGKGKNRARKASTELSAGIISAARAFLSETLCSYKAENVTEYNGNPVYFPPLFKVKNGVAFSFGVNIGEVRKNYIQPHHQFFMAMGRDFKRRIELSPDSDELRRYLHGESFECDCEDGWAVVTVCGCSVGGVKVVSGTAKNHYPKGLRSLGGV